jgi:hypothetical protein
MTLPHPPFHTIPHLPNFRDAAFDLHTSSGLPVRRNILFRSGEVSKVDAAGWKAVRELGVGRVFDLRSRVEVENSGMQVSSSLNREEEEGIERLWTPVFEDTDYSPARLASRYMLYMQDSTQGFVDAYRDILSHAGPAFKSILMYLSSLPPPRAGSETADDVKGLDVERETKRIGVLVHCTAGKDRTGVFYGVLFAFLGVERERIAQEYELTELGLAGMRDEVVKKIMSSVAFQEYIGRQVMDGDEEGQKKEKVREKNEEEQGNTNIEDVEERGREAALRMISARKEAMLGTLEMVDREWDSAEGYLKKVVGLEERDLDGLRRSLVMGA